MNDVFTVAALESLAGRPLPEYRAVIRSGPRALLVVHRIGPQAAFTTDCGRIAGDRRFDADLGTFVQDTAHHTLDAFQRYDGMTSCPDCLALNEVAS